MLPTTVAFVTRLSRSTIVRHRKMPFIEYFDVLEELYLALLGR
jgi:hypothetical protein